MTIELSDSGRLLLFEDGGALASAVSPRPYLHPICSPAGTLLTEIAPVDHPHHLGLSLALPDVNGSHHWGGKTYKPGRGYVWENRHGCQRVTDIRLGRLSESGVSERPRSGKCMGCTISWIGADGQTQLIENRDITWSVTGSATAPGAALLRWRSTVTPCRDTFVASPGVKGRKGAGYGGIFWRFPRWLDWCVFSSEAAGEEQVNGSCAEWITMHAASQGTSGAKDVSVVLWQSGPRVPWFVRTSEYPGACPALAWQESLRLPAGSPFIFGLNALILDADLGSAAQVERALLEVGGRQ